MTFHTYLNFCLLAVLIVASLMLLMASSFHTWFDNDEGDDDGLEMTQTGFHLPVKT